MNGIRRTLSGNLGTNRRGTIRPWAVALAACLMFNPSLRALGSEPAPAEMRQGTRGYTIQIGAYAARSHAEQLLARLQAKGYAVDMIADPDASGRQLFKVRSGLYASRAEATQAAVAFHQKEKLPYFIVESRKDPAAGPASRTAPPEKKIVPRNAPPKESGSRLDAAHGGTVTLVHLVAEAYRENPAIRQAREKWRAVVESYRVATGYPDPQIAVTYFTDPLETRLGPQDWNATLSQPIPFPGKLGKIGAIVSADARIAHIQLDKTVRNVTTAVRKSFHELGYIRTAQRVAAENLKLVEHLRKVGETAYARDRAAHVDMIKAQGQLGQLRYDQILLADLEQTEATRLNGLLNRPPDAPLAELSLPPIAPVAYSLEELYHLAEANQDDIRVAAMKLEKAGLAVDLARYETLPDFRVGLFYAAIGSPDVPLPPADAGRDAFGVQAGMTLPLWFGKNTGRMAKARAEVNQAQADQDNEINTVRTAIRTVFFRLENARRLVTLYRDELLPQVAGAMEVAETWFRQDESSFSDFVETQSVSYNFQLALARAQADYGKYLARLEQLAGDSVTVRTPKAETSATTKEAP